jgi:hypothetical protein
VAVTVASGGRTARQPPPGSPTPDHLRPTSRQASPDPRDGEGRRPPRGRHVRPAPTGPLPDQARHHAAGGPRWPLAGPRAAEPRGRGWPVHAATTAHITHHVPLRPHGSGADQLARTPTGDLRGTGVSAAWATGHPDPPCVTRGPARRSAAGTPRSPSAGPRVAEPRGPPPPISPTTSLCAHTGRAGTSGANTHRRPAGHRCLSVMPGPPATLTRPCVTHGPARRSAAGMPRSPSAGPRVAEPRGHHHPYHPPLTFAPTRAGRAPAGANTHRRPAGHRRLSVGRAGTSGKTCGVSATPEN